MHGRKGSGKDAIGLILREHLDFEPIALAAPLKAAAQSIFSFSHSQVYGSQEDKEKVDQRWGFSPRQALQWLGTQGLREGFGNKAVEEGVWSDSERTDIWVKILHERIVDKFKMRGQKRFVITDVRFGNEVAFLARKGALLLHTEREDLTIVDDHESESEVAVGKICDLLGVYNTTYRKIDNNSTLKNLETRILNITEVWLNKLQQPELRNE